MKVVKAAIVAVMATGLCVQAFGTEGGGDAYPNGAEGFMTGALPPPGRYLIDYNLYYTADELMDGSGNEIPIDFDLEVYGTVLRFVNVTEKTILGGSWAQHIFVPFLNVDVSTPGGDDDKFGLGDLIVDPIVLGWHRGDFHWAAGIDVYVPVGAYDEDDLANVGRNYWTIQPVLAGTYLNKAGCEASLKLMYDINFENDDTDYESGDSIHFDYTVATRVKQWAIGVGGFYYKQLGDDDGTVMTPGGPVDAGDNKGQQIAVGPQVAYHHSPMSFIFKYQKELETENKPEGDRFWLKFVTPF